jgi:hypothetical protein
LLLTYFTLLGKRGGPVLSVQLLTVQVLPSLSILKYLTCSH